MIFDTVRRSWHGERFKNHWAKISNLLGDRRDLESRGRKDMVLAVNYELVSHATRAQEALRKAEELGLELTKKADDVRELLSHLIELPALARAELETTRQQQIDRLYSEYLDHQRSSPLQEMDSDRSESQTADDDSGVSEAEVRRALNDQAQERLEQFDERTALLLVSKLRAQALESGMEVRGVSLAKRPMPVDERIRLMRMIYAAVGQPFEGESWYNLLIATWLTYLVRDERGELEFDYQSAVRRYRSKIAPKLGDSPHHEAAFANMSGAIYSLIADEPYDFRPPGQS